MIKGVTESGFAFELDAARLDNMELVDAIAEVDGGNLLVVSKLCRLLLGDSERKKLYDFVRVDGRVPISRVADLINEVLVAAGSAAKN